MSNPIYSIFKIGRAPPYFFYGRAVSVRHGAFFPLLRTSAVFPARLLVNVAQSEIPQIVQYDEIYPR